MGTKITSLIIALAAIVEMFTVHAWLACNHFTDVFHFSSINVTLQLNDYSNEDTGMPLLISRFFHNKLVQFPLDLLRLYLQFWDIRFGSNWFSLIGYFGIVAGCYYLIANKKKHFYHWMLLTLIVTLPFFEIIVEPHVSLLIKSLYLWLPFILFSLYGIYHFLKQGNLKKRIAFLFVLLLISFWWITYMPYDMPRYCAK